jgi:hypothetical protein
VAVLALSTTPCQATCLDEAYAFADKVCGEIQRGGSSRLLSASGGLSAEAKGLLSRFVGSANADVNGEVIEKTFEGVLQEQLGTERDAARNCRSDVAKFALKACKGSSAAEPKPEITATTRPLQQLSNLQLRESAIAQAVKLREFEKNVRENRPPDRPSPDPKELEAWTKRLTEYPLQAEQQFNSYYRGQTIELRDEITFRLNSIGVFDPYIDMLPLDQIGKMVLNSGFARAGANPFTCVANYLEKLARRLPP